MKLLSSAQYNTMFRHMDVVFTEQNKEEMLERVTGKKHTFTSSIKTTNTHQRISKEHPLAYDLTGQISLPLVLPGLAEAFDDLEVEDPYVNVTNIEQAKAIYNIEKLTEDNRGHLIGVFAQILTIVINTENIYMKQAFNELAQEFIWLTCLPTYSETIDLFDWIKTNNGENIDLQDAYKFIKDQTQSVIDRTLLAIDVNRAQEKVHERSFADREPIYQPYILVEAMIELSHWIKPLVPIDFKERKKSILSICSDISQDLGLDHPFTKELEKLKKECIDQGKEFDLSLLSTLRTHLEGKVQPHQSYIKSLPMELLSIKPFTISDEEMVQAKQLWSKLLDEKESFLPGDEKTPFIYVLATALRFLFPKDEVVEKEKGKIRTHNDMMVFLRHHCPDQRAIFDDLIARFCMAEDSTDRVGKELADSTVEKWGAAIRRHNPNALCVQVGALALLNETIGPMMEDIREEHRVDSHIVRRLWDAHEVLTRLESLFTNLPDNLLYKYDILYEELLESLIYAYSHHSAPITRDLFELYNKAFNFKKAFSIATEAINSSEAIDAILNELQTFLIAFLPLQTAFHETSSQVGGISSPRLPRKNSPALMRKERTKKTPLSIAFFSIPIEIQKAIIEKKEVSNHFYKEKRGKITLDHTNTPVQKEDTDLIIEFILNETSEVLKNHGLKKALHHAFEASIQEILAEASKTNREFPIHFIKLN